MTQETKQTAVDIAFEKLANQGLLVTRDYKNLVAYREAKEMEKEQIFNAFDFGDYCIDLPEGGWKQKYESAENYYNETYGGNK